MDRRILRRWTVNLDTQEATWSPAGARQVRKATSRLDVTPIAAELAQIIRSGTSDPRVRVRGDGSVQVVMARMFADNAPQTREGRRRRLKDALDKELGNDWIAERGNVPATWTPALNEDASSLIREARAG